MQVTSSFFIILLSSMLFIGQSWADESIAVEQKITVQIELPSFNKKHQNPYFSLWLSKENNQHKALVVIREKVKWLRDLKKFWRSIARENRSESDAVTGATSKNKTFDYVFTVNGLWDKISLEVAREHGKRELITLPISQSKTCVNGELEIEKFCIKLEKNY